MSLKRKAGEVAWVEYEKERILRIVDTEKGSQKNLSHQNFLYQFQLYGKYFHLLRLKKIAFTDFLNFLIPDIKSRNVANSVSRIDLCADLANITVQEIEENADGPDVEIGSYINRKKKTGETETYYPNKKKRKRRSSIRIYDKQKDLLDKGKAYLCPDYFYEENVTRMEVEIKSETIKSFQYNFYNLFKGDDLWSLFYRMFWNKRNKWNTVEKFIRPRIEKLGYKNVPLQRTYKKPLPIGETKAVQRYRNSGLLLAKEFKIDPAELAIEIFSFIERNLLNEREAEEIWNDPERRRKFINEQNKKDLLLRRTV